MINSDDFDQRTIETRLNCSQFYDLLDEIMAFYASLRHKLWRDLIIKRMPINALKSSYIKEYKVTARQFNSLAKDVSSMAKSLEELRKENLKAAQTKVAIQKNAIVLLNKKIKANHSTLASIVSFRGKVAAWKIRNQSSKKALKKPSMPISIRGKFKERLLIDLRKLTFALHQKKRRLGILEVRLNRILSSSRPSLCFGTKKLFRAQYHLEANGFTDHASWQESFTKARASRMTFIGSSDESFGNQTVQYDPKASTLSLRLPNAKQFEIYGKCLKIAGINFPEFLKEEFFHALSTPGIGAKKSQKTCLPVSYRFVRRINPNNKQKAYYLQASFAVRAPETTSILNSGIIGVDLNADHLAVCETDRFGNWIDSYILPFDLRALSSNQSEAILGDLVAVVVEAAKGKSKAIAIERLDFQEKKAKLRQMPKFRRKSLSQFAYAQFMAAMESRARRDGVSLISINPAYTSFIGAYKYQGLKISSHEKAALAIARRAQGFTEELGVFQGTLPSQVMMTEKTKFRETSRHVWGFYSDNQKSIRSLLIEKDRRPFLAVKRAFSLVMRKPSLNRSLVVIREKRVLDELSCSSA